MILWLNVKMYLKRTSIIWINNALKFFNKYRVIDRLYGWWLLDCDIIVCSFMNRTIQVSSNCLGSTGLGKKGNPLPVFFLLNIEIFIYWTLFFRCCVNPLHKKPIHLARRYWSFGSLTEKFSLPNSTQRGLWE